MISEGLDFGQTEGFRVRLSSEALAAMLDTATEAGRSETGGILIGRYDEMGWTATVTEATPKPPGSSAGWFWFLRGNKGLNALLGERWSQGLHYVGEWHFHPRGSPEPSGRDLKSMERIAASGDYHCPEPLLIILGGRPLEQWALSVWIVREGHKPLRLAENKGLKV